MTQELKPMNTELKAIVGTVFSGVQLVMNIVEKKGIVTSISDLEKLATSFAPVVTNWSSLTSELSDLDESAQGSDLLEYVVQQISALEGDAKTKEIVNCVIKLLGMVAIQSYGLVKTIKKEDV